MQQIEYFFTCPVCLSTISMLVDTSVAQQQYVEDCEVCCRPLELNLQCDVRSGTVLDVEVQLCY